MAPLEILSANKDCGERPPDGLELELKTPVGGDSSAHSVLGGTGRSAASAAGAIGGGMLELGGGLLGGMTTMSRCGSFKGPCCSFLHRKWRMLLCLCRSESLRDSCC